jgi:hypothetical protein
MTGRVATFQRVCACLWCGAEEHRGLPLVHFNGAGGGGGGRRFFGGFGDKKDVCAIVQ